jgi:hypothetical protein
LVDSRVKANKEILKYCCFAVAVTVAIVVAAASFTPRK